MKETSKSAQQVTGQEDLIHLSQLVAYGAGGIIPIALFNIAGILVGLMGNISLGLSAFWLGVILIIPRLWDALSDPIIGHISDNTRTRWGRRRPYLLIGGIAVALCFVIMWWIPKGEMVHAWFPTESGYQWFQLAYILVTLLLFFTAVNIFEIPHGALGMEMTADYHERTRLFSAKSFVGNLFAMSTPWLFALASMEVFKGPGGNEADGMRYVSILIAAILIPLSFWWTSRLREPGFVKAAKQEKTPFWKDMKQTATNRNFIMLTLTIFTLAMGFNFVNLLGSYIPIFYVFGGDKVAGATLLGINGTVWAVTGLLAVFPLNWVSPKLGKRNTLIVAMVLMCIAQLSKIFCYNPEYPYLVLIPTVLLSAGMLFFFTLGSSMVGDICDEDELKTGYRSEGSYYAVFWWFIKMGTALASFVAGVLIVFTMFDETQVTKVDSLQGSVRALQSSIQSWKDYSAITTPSAEWLNSIELKTAETLDGSRVYLTYLEKESAKKPERKSNIGETDHARRKNILLNAAALTKKNNEELEQVLRQIKEAQTNTDNASVKSLSEKTVPLTINAGLIKARLSSFELMLHLELKSEQTTNSTEHYNTLIHNITGVNKRLVEMNAYASPDSLSYELGILESEIAWLTKQTPYTLLMMRVVEIGLPFLLSLVAIFFVLRYSLTEKRSHEIKDLLKQRNADLMIGNSMVN